MKRKESQWWTGRLGPPNVPIMGQIKILTGILEEFMTDSKSYKKISMLLKNKYGGFILQISVFTMALLMWE